jgi:hypothetical protein
VPTWASSLALHLHLDAMTLHLTVLNLYQNPLSSMNQNFHLNKIRHVHAHHLEQVEE